MKFARFQLNTDGSILQAVLREQTLYVTEGDIWGKWNYKGPSYNLNEVTLLAPFVPNSIIGVGKNYIASGESKPEKLPDIPVFFYKPVSSVIGPEADIVIPAGAKEIKFESELAVIIGKQARHVSEQDALDYVFGYTITNDITASQFFHPDGHWMVGKSFDTFTPLGPVIETELDLTQVRVQAQHNGQRKQDSGLDLMILSIPFLIAYLSRVMTLQPGDVILSGSPAGADFMGASELIECQIDGIGILRNSTVLASH
ncbi:fumarylacetoacetate hydrolase family protein [Paenibacillus agricola]|uniref:Fumarylacetoacetate hydrolase family protein n=1 Tax=Paenibacillus agricola TaxID=2716264 RepID=A0ABX0JEA6_9BACL|nr:fumarylacetoacetate hydrolase family protein [Paenibacillus agricola]NHN33589.1 fumarylacetoacetate hydrolase family protein [Paenibacillus agricola]